MLCCHGNSSLILERAGRRKRLWSRHSLPSLREERRRHSERPGRPRGFFTVRPPPCQNTHTNTHVNQTRRLWIFHFTQRPTNSPNSKVCIQGEGLRFWSWRTWTGVLLLEGPNSMATIHMTFRQYLVSSKNAVQRKHHRFKTLRPSDLRSRKHGPP